MGKSRQLAHPKTTDHKVKLPFQLVFADLTEPLNPEDLEGYKFITKITDEYTKWTQVFIHTKREGSRRQVPAIYT